MNINLQKLLTNICNDENIECMMYFKQFNVYDTINCLKYMDRDTYYKNKEIKINTIETTIPTLSVISAKIIDTVEGTSLEGQYLSGKKLLLLGEISVSLIVNYKSGYYTNKMMIDVDIPFSIFIIIPPCVCTKQTINLCYLIEDVSTAYLGKDKILVSVTTLIQYLDEY